jgi:hypothetical protein
VISPATWFTDDPTTMFQLALAVNAVLGGIACVLLAVLAHRMTGRSRRTSAVLAAIAALAPGLLFTTNWVWSESLVQVAFLLVVVASLRFADTLSVRWGAALVIGTALGFATHSRLLPLAGLPVVLIVLGARRRALGGAEAAGLVALLGASLAAVSAFSRFVVDHVWDDRRPRTPPAAWSVASATSPRSGQSMVGQVWYQLVATAGLAGLGAIALGRAAVARRPGRLRTVDARIVLAAVTPLVALSIVFMTDRWRPDQIVYGRYNDAVMAPVLLAAMGAVAAATRRRLLVDGLAVVVATAGTGVVLRLTSHDELQAQALLRPMVIGLMPYVGSGRLAVLGVTVAALVVMAVGLAAIAVARGGRLRQFVALTFVALLLVVGYRRTQPRLDAAINTWASARDVEEVRGTVLPPGQPVRGRFITDSIVRVGVQRLRASLYEFYLPENPLYVDGRLPDGRWTPYVFAPVDDAELLAAGAEVVWRDPDVAIGLWVEPAPP